ncbi:conjugal transfer pilus assembly protein TraL [Serratia ficaria]|uniref:Protein TraL n=1 Tax=Serratia plymuthica TaxID=82996 RepID=A0A318NWH5_SERPL|nr:MULTISPECIES: type IV conjugative transfer system protein TraL [Serratia]PYD36582.1 type IV conjugative transfer system protein TraL [Serratia plymuthica]CAI2533809.1 conjugal transfer pilus assembly protein TraL [Serratia ficaria]
MSGEADEYAFPETLNEQSRFIGLPYDEIAIIAPLVGAGIYFNMAGTLSVMAAFLWWLIRYFKKGQGSTWLFNLAYWYLPSWLFTVAFKVVPDSGNRHWMK